MGIPIHKLLPQANAMWTKLWNMHEGWNISFFCTKGENQNCKYSRLMFNKCEMTSSMRVELVCSMLWDLSSSISSTCDAYNSQTDSGWNWTSNCKMCLYWPLFLVSTLPLGHYDWCNCFRSTTSLPQSLHKQSYCHHFSPPKSIYRLFHTFQQVKVPGKNYSRLTGCAIHTHVTFGREEHQERVSQVILQYKGCIKLIKVTTRLS